jgi:hypothetical protein
MNVSKKLLMIQSIMRNNEVSENTPLTKNQKKESQEKCEKEIIYYTTNE